MKYKSVFSLLAVLPACIAFILAPAASADYTSANPGPFTVSGSHILDAGQRWTPFGVTVSGLEHPSDWQHFAAADQAQIRDAARAWHANSVRLQVDQNMVDSRDAGFMSHLRAEVSLAQSLRMAVVINDQTEWDKGGRRPAYTAATRKFWKIITRQYGRDRDVMFDLLNEPVTRNWAKWQTGTQQMAAYVRSRTRAVLWVEGPGTADTLSQVRRYPITVPGIVYSIHHPKGPHTRANWRAQFGYLAARGVPVVDGEWTNWSSQRSECWADAPTAVPVYLSYLASLHVGMEIWALGWAGSNLNGYRGGYTGPGVLSVGSYDDPTHIRSNWSCRDGLHQGAGAYIQRWYARHDAWSHQMPDGLAPGHD